MGRRKRKIYLVEGVEIVDTSKKGKGIGKKDGKVYMVEKTVPGDIVDVMVLGTHKKVPQGRVENWVQPSPDRIEAKCQHFGNCGGCKWQSLSYEKQLFYKEKQVVDAMERLAGLEIADTRPIIGCDNPFNYRNKVEFSFSVRGWVPLDVLNSGVKIEWKGALGYHVAGLFDKIVDIETCHLAWPIIDDIRNELRRYAQDHQITFYDIRGQEGFLRNIVFRTSEASRELMLMLITGEDDPELVNRIFLNLEEKFPEITSFISIHNHKLNSTYFDLECKSWKGPAVVTESLGGWKYHISPTSFFQTNPTQAKILYDEIRKYAGEEKLGVIYDLYCGAGSIGIYVNDLAEKVVGIEYVESSIRDAHINCKLNNLSHLNFYAGDMRKLLTDELVEKEGRPDLVITDPPRAGMDEPVVRQLLIMAAPRIIYVSCNPATQARDLALLSEMYVVESIQPVDMFPQTTHVENIAYLVRKDLVQPIVEA